MNYKKCNIIGILSFIAIVFLMVNLNFFLEVLNYNVLNIKFVGIKNNELVLSELNETVLTKLELADYIKSNIEQIGMKKLENFEFAVHSRNVEEEDKFIENFRIGINSYFTENLNKSLDLIDENQDLLLKFLLYSGDKIYSSSIFEMKIVDEVYKNEGKIVLDLEDFSKSGTQSLVTLPKYLKLKAKNKIDIKAKHGELDIKDLKASFDESNMKLIIKDLVPLKDYSYIEISTKDSDNVDVILKIKNITTQPETKLQEYISKIYFVCLGRYPYESQYVTLLNQLTEHEISINKFLGDIILSEEFDIKNTTPKQIVDSIYYLVNKKSIDGRVSTLVLDEFNQELLNHETKSDTKIKVMNKFLHDEDSLNYIKNQLNLKVD